MNAIKLYTNIGVYVLLATVAVFLGGSGHSSHAREAPPGIYTMSEIVIDKEKDGQHHLVELNDRVIIRLSENPSTGFRWQTEAYDHRILVPLSSDLSMDDHSIVGAGGMRTFIFEAGSSGTTPLRFILKRSWEPKEQAIDHFEITIQVRNKQ